MRLSRSIAVLAAAGAALAAGAASVEAAAPAAGFDAPGQGHAIRCVRLAASPKPLLFADATPTGFQVTDQFSFTDGRCPAGTVRLDLHEVIPSEAGAMVFHRGGNGYANDQNVKYGELATADIADALAAAAPSSGGRGAPCDLASEPAYEVQVRSIPSAMKYKRPQDVPNGNNSGASYLHYGDPGADQGDRDDIHYSYLVWSWVDVRGGGHVRTLLKPGQVVRACDVQSITMDAWDRQGAVNGQVTARYVRVLAGSCPVYGWMAWSHDDLTDTAGPVAHAIAAGSTPPPDPTPDPSCPVAEQATAPIVDTGDPAPAAESSAWTLAGTVNPKGVPTTWWFEYGLGPDYGAATPAGALAPADRLNAVSAAVDGLAPGATYHYRLVASSAHGTTYGADRTLTTPAPPPPPPPPAPPPEVRTAALPPQLRSLAVSPSAFARTRSPRESAARIRFDISVAGTLELTFLRATIGMRAGSQCARAPRRGVPRGRRRCTRWVPEPGTLTRRASAGVAEIRFGGWVGTRALPAGRYRLHAVPLDADGRVGASRETTFVLR